jgi:RNA polymerase sigma factor (sigma-70 family)
LELRPEHRRCFRLRHVEQRSYAEIARLMHVSVSTVGTYLQRAREELKRMLQPAA